MKTEDVYRYIKHRLIDIGGHSIDNATYFEDGYFDISIVLFDYEDSYSIIVKNGVCEIRTTLESIIDKDSQDFLNEQIFDIVWEILSIYYIYYEEYEY